MTGLLNLTEHLPVVELGSGDEVIHEDTRTGSVWILVSGACEVLKDGVVVNVIDRPGAAIGEVAALTGADHGATVVATAPTVLRFAEDGRALLLEHPEILLHVATGLAERLDTITRYLADLRNQYAGAPGLDLVGGVLGRLLDDPGPPPITGSRRDPDPEY